MTFKQNILASADALKQAVTDLDSAEDGDMTGVPQAAQDAVNAFVLEEEAAAAGTATARANALKAIADTIPDPAPADEIQDPAS
jgi:hypothetical protein